MGGQSTLLGTVGLGRADKGSGSLVAAVYSMVCTATGVQLSLNTKKQSMVLSFTAATGSYVERGGPTRPGCHPWVLMADVLSSMSSIFSHMKQGGESVTEPNLSLLALKPLY